MDHALSRIRQHPTGLPAIGVPAGVSATPEAIVPRRSAAAVVLVPQRLCWRQVCRRDLRRLGLLVRQQPGGNRRIAGLRADVLKLFTTWGRPRHRPSAGSALTSGFMQLLALSRFVKHACKVTEHIAVHLIDVLKCWGVQAPH